MGQIFGTLIFLGGRCSCRKFHKIRPVLARFKRNFPEIYHAPFRVPCHPPSSGVNFRVRLSARDETFFADFCQLFERESDAKKLHVFKFTNIFAQIRFFVKKVDMYFRFFSLRVFAAVIKMKGP